ncbi:unnamed protein product [Polarella glacialis]|uniref:Deoxyribodipyrimidine photo-lyase n=1 Tax=Polarella glacialis TaxID=89957 RepID=A0A813I3B3_POLGL|nr:unnamed protein product [Polarella glacialis]
MSGRSGPSVDPRRCRALNAVAVAEAGSRSGGSVVYWMSRDQRAQDNWALLKAQELALERKASLYVCFCLVPKFLDGTIRHFDFMLRGLAETSKDLQSHNVGFELLKGRSVEEVPKFVKLLQRLGKKGPVHAVVCDFSPLRVPSEWAHGVAAALQKMAVPLVQVDAHNVVPVWEASDHQEVGARTLRPKIMGRLKEFLVPFPPLRKHPRAPLTGKGAFNLDAALKSLQVDRRVGPVSFFKPGAAAAKHQLEDFLRRRLKAFDTQRNNPNVEALSGLSPWIKFGQISAARCALVVQQAGKGDTKKSAEGFVEEAVVRRELADNFCFYNKHYDSLKGAAEWAAKSLQKHSKDKREYVYTRAQLEQAKTHDDLWNASQRQMVSEGKMHGFLRMYWAKKVLEWTKSPEEALATVIYLNDRYSMDGRDPNGYVGCMWSICGVHDMGWAERKVFGKIRYMNYAGCCKKFRVAEFEQRYSSSGSKGSGSGAAASPSGSGKGSADEAASSKQTKPRRPPGRSSRAKQTLRSATGSKRAKAKPLRNRNSASASAASSKRTRSSKTVKGRSSSSAKRRKP